MWVGAENSQKNADANQGSGEASSDVLDIGAGTHKAPSLSPGHSLQPAQSGFSAAGLRPCRAGGVESGIGRAEAASGLKR